MGKIQPEGSKQACEGLWDAPQELLLCYIEPVKAISLHVGGKTESLVCCYCTSLIFKIAEAGCWVRSVIHPRGHRVNYIPTFTSHPFIISLSRRLYKRQMSELSSGSPLFFFLVFF